MGAGAARAEVRLSVGTGAYWYHQEAFDQTAAQFLGDRAPDTSTSGTIGLGPTLSSGADTQVRARAHQALALTWRHQHQIAPRWQAVTGVRLEWGKTRYALPQGLGVLRDPITIRLRHLAAIPHAALRWDAGRAGPVQFALEGGVGVDLARARTVLTSALLDVRRTQWATDAHGFITLEMAHSARPGASLALSVQWRDSIGPALRLGLQHRF